MPTTLAPRAAAWSVERHAPGVVILRSAAQDPEPANWPEVLAGFLHSSPGVVAVGAKRLDPSGRVHAMGEFVIHPKGFHHSGAGVEGRCWRFVEEVDLIAGGALAVDEDAF